MEEMYARIEDYLDGAMPEAERAVFEADLAADPALAAALTDLREARERLAHQWASAPDEAALRKTLAPLGQHFFGQNSAVQPGQPSKLGNVASSVWIWVAAVLLAAALLAWMLWPKAEPEQRLYAEFRRFPEASFTLKSSGATSSQTLAQAELDFNQKNYAAALLTLRAYWAAHPEDLEARFFMGLCELELAQTEVALATFSAIADGGGVWAGESRWYLALSHLRNKNRAACTAILQKIQAGQPHYEEAKKMLGRL